MRGCACTVLAEDSAGMRVVNHNESVVLLGEFNDVGQGSDVSVHAEYTVGNDHSLAELLRVAEDLLEVIHVLVVVDIALGLLVLRSSKSDAIDDAGVVELVAD